MPLQNERSRLSAEDWENGALVMIAEQGVNALAVEALARRLGVTKGSFYWHFPTREALLKAALLRWEARDERELSTRIAPIVDPRARLRELFLWVAREVQPHRAYAAMLQAIDQPSVAEVMSRVSQRRMEFLRQAYSEAGMPPDEAAHRARLAYAAYAGFLQLNLIPDLPPLSREQFDAYVEHVIDTLVERNGSA
ncbi:MAG TPA: helix-turn-helix domain-containing protein [Rhodanobacteraceae bacterium]|nr:helix-turn-helix domain-containing protein [Rhodanobacteraceae bacterium]